MTGINFEVNKSMEIKLKKRPPRTSRGWHGSA
jgi:hypothetical protein